MCSALECKILCGKKWLEDADKTESRATFRNEIHFVLVRTVEGWNFVQRLWQAFLKDFHLFAALWWFTLEHVAVVGFW